MNVDSMYRIVNQHNFFRVVIAAWFLIIVSARPRKPLHTILVKRIFLGCFEPADVEDDIFITCNDLFCTAATAYSSWQQVSKFSITRETK